MSKIRKLENFHILLWLLKDMSWLMSWKISGIFMIFPTIGFAIFITYQWRKDIDELFSNLAVTFWIIANSTWMALEFAELDKFKIYSIIPFAIGLSLISYRYLTSFLNR